jgi:4-hydroxy-tetrahydrodipicolinate reductase
VRPLVLFGVTGRMGQSILTVLGENTQLCLGAAIASPESPRLGETLHLASAAGGRDPVRISSDARSALTGAAVALDFSLAAAVAAHAADCAAAGVPLVVGATGLDAATQEAIRTAAMRIPVLIAPNTSLGVGVLLKLAKLAATALGEGYDVEIFEAHHRAKRDAPSGTALSLAAGIAEARGRDLADVAVYGRHGATGPRPRGSIGFSVVRAGDIVGEHTVFFTADGERLELTHRATDRLCFARGAIRAAEWLIGRSPGLYSMQDMLGL